MCSYNKYSYKKVSRQKDIRQKNGCLVMKE